ncbi:MAG: hypothetical protein ACI4ED_04780 [Suilimivivens sp.]
MILNRFLSQKHKITKAAVLVLITGAVALTACAGEEEESFVSLLKDGSVDSTIVEDFDKAYYDKDELQKMILEEAASYNRSVGEGAISIDKISVADGVAKVKMIYAGADDYAAFNDMIFFVGTVQEAKEAGYDLNKVLSSATDRLATVGMSDMLAMEDVNILITDMKEPVILNGKALYISGNVTVDKKYKTVSFDESSEGLAYVIYK